MYVPTVSPVIDVVREPGELILTAEGVLQVQAPVVDPEPAVTLTEELRHTVDGPVINRSMSILRT